MNLHYLLRKAIDHSVSLIWRLETALSPVDRQSVVFISYHGKEFSDSPAVLFDAMNQDPRFKNHKKIWLIRHLHQKPALQKQIESQNGIALEYHSPAAIKALCSAGLWIANCKLPAYMKKRPEQKYLQTWHGTPLKRLGLDIPLRKGQTFYRCRMSGRQMHDSYKKAFAQCSWIAAPNAIAAKRFQSAFGVDASRIFVPGSLRAQQIAGISEKHLDHLRQEMGLPAGKKVVLYAPTYRDHLQKAHGYFLENQLHFKKWQEKLKDDYIVIFRPHYMISQAPVIEDDLKEFVFCADSQSDIAPLLALSDVLITDYSSICFDFAPLNRPVLFYMPDLDEYTRQARDLYEPIEKMDLCGPVFFEEETLIQAVDRLRLSKPQNEPTPVPMASQAVLDMLAKEGCL